MSASSLNQTVYGGLYFATVLSTVFYGATCMQTFFYYIHYENDPVRTKGFVAILWVVDTVHNALVISGTYKYIMTAIVDPLAITKGVPELFIMFTALAGVPTQGFFVYRIYVFSGKNIVAPLIWAPLATYHLVSSSISTARVLYMTASMRSAESDVVGDDIFVGLSISSLSVAAGVDVLIAIFLTFLLYRERSAVTFPSAVHVLRRLILFAVNTGIWSATFAFLTVILFHFDPYNSIYNVFGIPLCSVYCNTLLANLNARSYIRGEETTPPLDIDLRMIGCFQTDDQQSGDIKLINTSECPEHHEGAMPSEANPSITQAENV